MTEFTKANGLKLLTHSDPEVMLDEAALEREVGGEEKLAPDYIIRYQGPSSIENFSFKTYIFCGSFVYKSFQFGTFSQSKHFPIFLCKTI